MGPHQSKQNELRVRNLNQLKESVKKIKSQSQKSDSDNRVPVPSEPSHHDRHVTFVSDVLFIFDYRIDDTRMLQKICHARDLHQLAKNRFQKTIPVSH